MHPPARSLLLLLLPLTATTATTATTRATSTPSTPTTLALARARALTRALHQSHLLLVLVLTDEALLPRTVLVPISTPMPTHIIDYKKLWNSDAMHFGPSFHFYSYSYRYT